MKHLAHGTHLYTSGWLGQHFQQPPNKVRAVLHARNIQPALVLNGIRHFGGDAYAAMGEFVREAERDG